MYLGAAPGVGKTFAMLNEGRRAKERGVDVVVGFVETHGRARTAEQVGDLEFVARKQLMYRGATFEEMDVDAILARRPERALVDELAHTNVPGSYNEKRWQDVEDLLDAGIDVISTVNIQHLEMLNDVVETITGIRQHETIPDEMVRAADQVELVDQTPEALRRRMAHGNIYPPEKIDASMANYFREGNLAALRELALLWLADKVDVGLEDYRERHGITQPWETRERVVVALTGAPSTEDLIRRAARIAQRAHGELLGVHVQRDDGLTGPPSALLDQHRRLLTDFGGEYREVAGSDIAAALVEVARIENATQLVLGTSRRSRWAELTNGSVINRVIRLSGPIDVHVISHERATASHVAHADTGSPRGRVLSRVPPRRQAAGWMLTVVGVALLTLVLSQVRGQIGLPTVLLLYLAVVMTTAAVGGRWPAIAAAVVALLAANWYFTPPFHRWTISEGENVIALTVFLGVAIFVSHFVDVAARRGAEATRARSEARTLAGLAATMGEDDPLPTLLGYLRTVFTADAAALMRRTGKTWSVEAIAGEPVPIAPGGNDVIEELGTPDVVLVLTGAQIVAGDRAVLNAFAAQLSAVLERNSLRAEAGRAQILAEANELRGALLQAVSHDLRTPLASIKASATSLTQPDVQWSMEDTTEFVQTINGETDRLITLVEHLLDMSRIQVGAVQPALRPVALEEVVPAAVSSLGPRGAVVDAQISETLPPMLADAALLERALANIIDNAVRLSPPGRRVRVETGAFAGHIDINVIDRGPGIPANQRDRVFQPFQRLGDNQPGTGVGLGLAVAKGFLASMGATIEIDDTPGGGTTITVRVPAA